MQRIVLACAVLSLALLASPTAAQQADSNAPAAPPAPEPYQLPPPPPFPPMPKSDPHHRWVDTGGNRSSAKRHETVRTRHKASTAHRSKTRAHRSKTTAHHAKAKAHRTPARPAAVHLSRKTIRQCHAMSYKQIMGHKNCRALMQQELAAADRHRATAHKHKAKTARKHSTKRRRK